MAEETMRDAATEWRHYGGLVALALAALANAHRILGDTASASNCLVRAEPYIRGETDAVMRWEYFGLVAATCTHLRRLDEARRALERALALSREMGDRHRTAKALVQRSYLDFAGGALSQESLDRLNTALRLGDPARERNFRAMVLLNIVANQVELGLIDEAETTWGKISPLDDSSLELRRQVLLGFVHLGARRWDAACREFAASVDAMVATNHIDAPYFQLLYGLALFGAGKYSEGVQRVSPAARFYASVGIDSVALAAKQVVTEAASGSLNAAHVEQLVCAIKVRPHRHAGPQTMLAPGANHWASLLLKHGSPPP